MKDSPQMAHYKVCATVSVNVEISIEAASQEQAIRIFKDGICMTADLLDVAAEHTVDEDSISDVEIGRVQLLGNP